MAQTGGRTVVSDENNELMVLMCKVPCKKCCAQNPAFKVLCANCCVPSHACKVSCVQSPLRKVLCA